MSVSAKRPTDLFHLGPPKTATTWAYHCLRAHPDICTSSADVIHYYDIHYPKGQGWYDSQFTVNPSGHIRFDPTYSYICSPYALDRIWAENPNAKYMLCLRNPVERAFSHYWHLKKSQLEPHIEFTDVLKHYNNFATWVEHGFVATALKRLMDKIPPERIHVMMFEDIARDSPGEYQKMTEFIGISHHNAPSVVAQRVNVAGAKRGWLRKGSNKMLRLAFGREGSENLARRHHWARKLSGKAEYIEGISPALQAELTALCMPEIEALEALLKIDLSHWKNIEEQGQAAYA